MRGKEKIKTARVPPALRKELVEKAKGKYLSAEGNPYVKDIIDEHVPGKRRPAQIKSDWEQLKRRRKIRRSCPSDKTIIEFFTQDKEHQPALINGFCQLILNCTYSQWLRKNPSLHNNDETKEQAEVSHELAGIWKSTYQIYQDRENQHEWIVEDVNIAVHQSTFRIVSDSNPIADNYIAEGKIMHGVYFVGNWHSTRLDQALGVFMLTISVRRGIMYGYFTGPRNSGERIYGAWILAKVENELQEGKRLLKEFTLALNQESIQVM